MINTDDSSQIDNTQAIIAANTGVEDLMEDFSHDTAVRQRHYDAFQLEQPQLFEIIQQFGHLPKQKNALPADQYEAMRDYIVAFYSTIRCTYELDEIFTEEFEQYFSYIQNGNNTSAQNSAMHKAIAEKIKLFGEEHKKELLYLSNMIFSISMSICIKGLNLEDDDECYYEPLDYDDLQDFYMGYLREGNINSKEMMLLSTMSECPFLASMVEDARHSFKKSASNNGGDYCGNIPELIHATYLAVSRDTDMSELQEQDIKESKSVAKELVDSAQKDEELFHATLDDFAESQLLEFLYDNVIKMNLPKATLRKKLIDVLSIGIALGKLREEQVCDNEECREEEYDFDSADIKVLQLRIKLCGYKTYADIQIREDQTFSDLHDCINTLFQRDDEHLYRFECEDGCVAVHELDDSEDAVASTGCFIGHHLFIGSGAHYIYDYGANWEHDIKVMKILNRYKSDEYPKTIKESGEIPEQYPDYD